MSFQQSNNISITAFEPLIIGTNIIDDEIGAKSESYSQAISAIGGYDSASIQINDNQKNIEEWFANGLMRHIETYNPSLVKIWEGFVNEIKISLGALSVTRGPIIEVDNNVALTYSTIDTSIRPPAIGMRATTDFNSDSDSVARYGQFDAIFNTGGLRAGLADGIRDVFLNENKNPQTSQKIIIGQSGNISLEIKCLGYHHLFKRYIHNDVVNGGTANLSDQLVTVIAADPNSIFSTDTTKITSNTLQVKQYLDGNASAWKLIQGLIARGDANDNRYIFGIYNNRVPEYRAIPTDFEYQQQLSDPAQRVETKTGVEVKPWDVKPGRWLFIPDFLIGRILPTELRLDPRMIFIEKVTFIAPWNLQIQGGKTDELSQKLAKLGLGGVGNGV